MAIYLKKFLNHTLYETYINGGDAVLPNVSICATERDVHYNPYVETMVVAKYNVTESTMTQKILGHSLNGSTTAVTTAFTSVYVDGNEIEISDANVNYTFDTVGEHTVKYELKDPTTINRGAFVGNNAGGPPTGIHAVSIAIPDSVTSIGSGAFAYCRSLTSVTIGSGVTTIDNDAFQTCTSLTSVIIGSSVTSIGNYAFGSCTSLASIEIPNSVTSIGTSAFQYCSSLTSIVSNAATAPTITNTTFNNVKTGGTLTVPSGSSGYDVWMGTGNYYLGKYNWTKVEK